MFEHAKVSLDDLETARQELVLAREWLAIQYWPMDSVEQNPATLEQTCLQAHDYMTEELIRALRNLLPIGNDFTQEVIHFKQVIEEARSKPKKRRPQKRRFTQGSSQALG